MPEDKPAAPSAREALMKVASAMTDYETLGYDAYVRKYGQADPMSVFLALAEQVGEPKDANVILQHLLDKGVIRIRSERMVPHDSDTRCSWIEAVDGKAADVSNEWADSMLSAAPDRRKG